MSFKKILNWKRKARLGAATTNVTTTDAAAAAATSYNFSELSTSAGAL